MKIATTKMLTLAVAAAAGLMAATQAKAAVLSTYSLQFDPTSTGFASASSATVSAGQTVTLDVFVSITNGDSNHANDGLLAATMIFQATGAAVTGTTAGNGQFTGATAITSGTPSWSGSNVGTVNATNTNQWGATAAVSASSTNDYNISNVTTTNFGSGAGAGATVFQVGTIKYIVSSTAAGNSTASLVATPVAKSNGTGYANFTSDSTQVAASSTSNGADLGSGAAAIVTIAPPIGATTGISLDSAGPATNGNVTVLKSSPGNYEGRVLDLRTTANTNGTGVNTGVVGIPDTDSTHGIGTDGTEVLLWLGGTDTATGNAANTQTGLSDVITALQAGLDGGTTAAASFFDKFTTNDADAFNLLNNYPTIAANGATVTGLGTDGLLLVRFPNGSLASYNDFLKFALPSGVTLDAVTAVPEPASLGLLALGGLGLISRRRTSKR